AGMVARGRMWRAASASAVALHPTESPLRAAPTIRMVRVTGLATTLASRKTKVTSARAEEVFPEVIAHQLDHVAHHLVPPPHVLVERDSVAVADLDGVDLARLDLAGDGRARHPAERGDLLG